MKIRVTGIKRGRHLKRQLWKNARLVSGRRQFAGTVVTQFSSKGARYVVFRLRRVIKAHTAKRRQKK
jgi:hypothetical protein